MVSGIGPLALVGFRPDTEFSKKIVVVSSKKKLVTKW